MKKTANIIIALSTAICSVAAQGTQTTLGTTVDSTDSTLAKTESAEEVAPIEFVRPLFEPETKFLSIGFGGGISTIKYDTNFGDRNPMGGGSINFDYNIFFGQRKVGLSFGLGASIYNAKTTIDTRYTTHSVIPVTYSDGTTVMEKSELYTDFNNWEERQTTFALETPIGLLFRKYLKGNTSLLLGAGLKLSYPLKTTFRVKSGDRTTSGYLGSADMEINPDLSQHGFAKLHVRPTGTVETKHVAAGLYLDANFVHKTDNADFFWGVYGSLGLSNIIKDNNGSLNNINDYCGVLASNSVDAAKLNAIGVRLGVKLPCPKLKDDDGDGVYNKYDKCHGTPAGVEVDTCGCPLDADKDSVPDYLDKCPNTPKGIKVDSVGCPIDSDGDGIADYLDKCPNTPDSVQVDANGCPVDSDKDGVPDYLDKCPNTPIGRKVDKNGCPYDSDGDGVNDINDKCPDTPEGIEVDAKGCPMDSDGDGVPDYLDKCPNIKGPATNDGCPVVSAKAKAVFKQAMHGIQFETNKAVIKKSSYPMIDKVVNVMKENPQYKLHISGHTDNVGKPDKNMKLSKERAAAVVKYLSDKGVRPSRLRSSGYGDTQPVASNKTEAGRKQNRRVNFEVEF